MRAVIFSDVHIHPFQPFSRVDSETGLNSRLLDCVSAFRQAREYCKRNDIGYCLNGGDLLHKGATVQADVLELLVHELMEFKLENIEVISVTGQHDFLKRDGIYNLPKALSPLMTVLNEPGDYEDYYDDYDGMRIIGCSYRDGLENQREALRKCGNSINPKKTNIFLGHFMVQEILKKNAAPFDTSGYVSLDDFPKGLDWIFLGDYHYHVNIPSRRIVSIGGLLQHSFGDKNREQGAFLDVDFSQVKDGIIDMKRIEVEAPMFIKVKVGEEFPGKYSPKNFYAVEIENEKQQDQISAKLDDSWNVTFPRKLSEEEEQLTQVSDGVSVDIEMAPEEVIKRFCKHFGLDTNYLERGLTYIQ